MKIRKVSLAQIDKVYAVCLLLVDGKTRLLYATEGQGPCYQFEFTGPDFKKSDVWEGPGGTMTIVPIPETNGEFLAVQNFFPTFQGQKAIVVRAKPKPDGAWDVKKVLDLPYVHRMDVFRVGDVNYFLGCTIANSKTSKEDWSDPGKVWLGVLPSSPEESFTVSPLLEHLTRNHGYARLQWKGKERAFVTANEGVHILTPPATPGGKWEIEKLLDRAVSDIAVCDIDNDGELELLTIEPFHGPTIAISKNVGNSYEIVWRYEDKPVEFAHVAWGGRLCGEPTFIAGYRRQACDLFYIQCESTSPLKFRVTMIEEGVGTANISVLRQGDQDAIAAANRTHGEAAIYFVRP